MIQRLRKTRLEVKRRTRGGLSTAHFNRLSRPPEVVRFPQSPEHDSSPEESSRRQAQARPSFFCSLLRRQPACRWIWLGRSSDRACYNAIEVSSHDMKCPFCGFENDKVVDSRESKEADSIRRRRECLKCGKRFTTYERIDEIPYMVVKKDGRREKFDRQKVLNGLLRACEKRPVPISRLEQIVNEAEAFVIDSAERERKTSEVGELIMNRLRRYDKVAYVRFASVYLDFKDVQEFMTELKDLLKTKEPSEVRSKGAVRS
jgi:transcriptional repressor NrdR